MTDTEPQKCKHCGGQLERRPAMFYWRGRYFHGLVCVKDNALYDDPTDSFMEHVGKQQVI